VGHFRESPGSFLLHPILVFPEDIGCSGKGFHERWIEVLLEERQSFVTDSIPREAAVLIGAIQSKRDPPSSEKNVDFFAFDLQEGTDKNFFDHGVNGGKTRGSRPSDEPQQERLGLVVPCMSKRNACAPESAGRRLEETAAFQSARLLQGSATSAGIAGHIGPLGNELKPRSFCQLAAENLVLVRFRPELMVEMREYHVER
jgi:hypothetical protein